MTELHKIAQAMVASGKGILAADESTGTIQKRFDSIKVENTETNRRDYREMLFRTKGAESAISGVILFEETLGQKAADGTPLVKLLQDVGVIPGVKVDKGTKPLAFHGEETITEGLDGLRERLAGYYKQGARFTKWRAVFKIGPDMPSASSITANAHALARYAALSQEQGLVPIVEPEVLMDGDHDIEVCEVVTAEALRATFSELDVAEVDLEGMVLKPNMVLPGQDSTEPVSAEEIAERTVGVFRRIVPAAVPGIAFLSGGQNDEAATVNLNAMNRLGPQPWKLTFSYGRGLQAGPLAAWAGKKENVAKAQAVYLERAKANGLAALGRYKS